MSLIKPGICHGQVRPSRTSFGVTEDELGIRGEQDVQFCVANWQYRHTFCVCPLPTSTDRILGIDFLAETSASLDIGKRELRLRKRPMANSGSSKRRPSRGSANYDRATLTVLSETDVKQHKGKQTPKSDFETKRNACPKTGRGNASCCDAQLATVERQHGGKARKRKSRLSRKRQVVQVNQLKPMHDADTRESKPRLRRKSKTRRHNATNQASEVLEVFRSGPHPQAVQKPRQDDVTAKQLATARDSSHRVQVTSDRTA